MSKQEATGKRARMFVALDLPEVVREEIASWGEKELADPALRRVEPDSLHVTLAFLGDRRLRDIGPIAEVMDVVGDRPMPMELGVAEGRPKRGRPRLIALPVQGESVMWLEDMLARLLAFEGLYRSEKRPFWPHVTVARVRNEGGGSEQARRIEVPSGTSPTERIGTFDAVRISLYRSELQPRGARYVPLAQVELPQ